MADLKEGAAPNDIIVGIDLGTTNSEVAAYVGDRVRVLGPVDEKMLPSCVGLTPEGELMIGQTARNQQLLYPERTIRSVKRKMGSTESLVLGDREYSPQEISSLILRELIGWAEVALGAKPTKAVITVPAYFSDAQRQATREAGALAGLEVLRIVNEPTAAALAYGQSDQTHRKVMVYDLGGGTFDVSIVSIEEDVTEVLSSHGDNQLGGDDFDDLLFARFLDVFREKHGVELDKGHAAARARLWWAAEDIKKRLSSEPFATLREENLVTIDGEPRHLEYEISQEDYEAMIRPLVESTLDKVNQALTDAGLRSNEVDDIVLVGGSTRTPMIARILEERTGIKPHREVDPDLCVALGAGILASRLSGHEVERVLVDVTPYSFGVSYLDERGGVPYPHCYRAIIERGTPLPVTRTKHFYTVYPNQEGVNVCVYQGDDPDALRNILVGDFYVEGLTPAAAQNVILCQMRLDLDGILQVTAIEKNTGLSKHITISNAMKEMDPEELKKARARMESLFASNRSRAWDQDVDALDVDVEFEDDDADADSESTEAAVDPEWIQLVNQGRAIQERARLRLPSLNEDDKEEVIDLNGMIEKAIEEEDAGALQEVIDELRELLFFVEG